MAKQTSGKKGPPPEIHWTERISVGVKDIDDQHKHLIGIANKLIRALHSGLADKMVAPIIRSLREYTVYHFRDEEKFMRDMGFPHLAEHHREHQALTARVKEYQDALYRKQDIRPTEIRDFIKDWLINHILRSDGRIADFVREEGKSDRNAERKPETNEGREEKAPEQVVDSPAKEDEPSGRPSGADNAADENG
jgi:hemerythrin-like metal-binding protein